MDGFFLDALLIDLEVLDLAVLLDFPEDDDFLDDGLLLFDPEDGLRFLLAM